jgi:hypothetical protein
VNWILLIILLAGPPSKRHKRVIEFPPEPVVVPRKLSPLVPVQTVTLTLSFTNPNTNTATQRWVIESTPDLVNPSWRVITNGVVPAGWDVEVQIDHQQPRQFYRAGFVWP